MEQEYLDAMSWCFANDIVVRWHFADSQTVYKLRNGNKMYKTPLYDVKLAIYSNGKLLKEGEQVFKQKSVEVVEKTREIYLHFYRNRARN